MSECYLRDDLAAELGSKGLLEWGLQAAQAAAPKDIFRAREGRLTVRLVRGGKPYFLKYHGGIGWREIFKNLLQLRWPVLGASNEYEAVNRLHSLGVDTMTVAAYARAGLNPARQRSLIVTDELVGTVSLEDYCRNWRDKPPPWSERVALIAKLADSARRMHRGGINHRDFYLCHFHLDPNSLNSGSLRCYLIDLHRAQLRPKTPSRWLAKDLSGLYFSAMDCGLRQRDLLRFLRHYTVGGLRVALGRDLDFWRRVEGLALRLYHKDHGHAPPPGPWERGR
ncbi:lipopolysaccharide core heptose(I) kinase RfaP [Sediminihaliea albiluteola]|uniref:lipopolysaccharide core heptose(I) kinase RfaP n=1 Tax=Sediminihaliea albiluteola TaxID=2758564 RepID=UPI002E2AE40D|nr:lipopolysaccharide core heptose(I) kinase RfaP [Sediminihaliea albiluteola]